MLCRRRVEICMLYFLLQTRPLFNIDRGIIVELCACNLRISMDLPCRGHVAGEMTCIDLEPRDHTYARSKYS